MLLRFADFVVYRLGGFAPDSKFGVALHFFVHDAAKILVLLFAMVFAMGVIRTWLPEDKLKRWMTGRGVMGNFVASLFGALTPFCSCSSIPIFISLLKAGAPLGVTFSFLITSPLINEYLAVIMAAEFGLPTTAAYVLCGLAIGTGVGTILGRMNLEKYLEHDMLGSPYDFKHTGKHTLATRLHFGWSEAVFVVRQIWVWVLAGVAVGAAIHNYVPKETIAGIVGAAGVFGVPIATIIGVPMYGSCAAIVPIAVVLFEKGIPLGTALAFMMAVSALSFPEAIMLRRVMKLQLIGIFFGTTTVAIVAIGYLLNFLAPML